MKSNDRGFSIEGLTGTVVALLTLLINPEVPGWRIFILAFAGVLLLDAVRKSQWAKRTNPILTLEGEFFPDDTESFLRKLLAFAFVVIAITAFGFVTWPTKEFGIPADAVVLTDPVTPPIQFHPTPKVVPPNPPAIQPEAEQKPPTGHVTGAPAKNVQPPKPVAPGPPTNVRAIAQ